MRYTVNLSRPFIRPYESLAVVPTPSFPNAPVGNPGSYMVVGSRQRHSGMTALVLSLVLRTGSRQRHSGMTACVRVDGVRAGFPIGAFGNDGLLSQPSFLPKPAESNKGRDYECVLNLPHLYFTGNVLLSRGNIIRQRLFPGPKFCKSKRFECL